jgi:hypothetical protein
MRLTKKVIKALETVVIHSRIDMDYGEGGSFSTVDGDIDKNDVELAKLGNNFILSLIKERRDRNV